MHKNYRTNWTPQNVLEGPKVSKLEFRYHEHIQSVHDFILAERLSEFQLHIDSSAKMLPVMMAAGHSQYGKAIRFTLQQFMQFDGQTKAFFISNKHPQSNIQATSGVAYGRTNQLSKL